jgi:ribonuclease R
MAKPLSERILDFLQQSDYRPMKARRLARVMSIGEAELGDFHDAVDALRRVGRVVIGTRSALMLPHRSGQVSGTYRANPAGFGFVIQDETTEHGDLYIPKGNSGDALTGDRVLCLVVKRGKRDGKMSLGGKIVRVLERGDNRFVGQLQQEGELWYVRPDGNTLHVPIFIGDPGAKSARSGDQVVVEITQYPAEGQPAQGVITERLGERGQQGVDLLTIVRQYNLPDAFPPPVLSETRERVKSFNADAAARDREDLSDRVIITIDPDDARDYDDAISLERTAGGGGKGKGKRAQWELGVHIADVSAFVTPGSALDVEAEQRGTSVYLPGQVIPMLPEVLSNGLCSLQEGEPRLTKSVFIQYSEKGRVLGARYANSLIRSTKRLTYGQATEILEGKTGNHKRRVIELVREMEQLANVIRSRRLEQGMLVLDLPAVDLVLDEEGRVVDAKPEDTSFSHTLIEMFMVEANEAVARLMHERGIPCLRRIHPDPDEDAITSIGRFLRVAGLPMAKQVTTRNLQKLLDRLRGMPEAYAVNLAVLKSLQMAEYSPKPVGHFALASDHYAHFTSPIRRYPDLLLHRLLDGVLDGTLKKGKRKGGLPAAEANPAVLEEMGRRMSFLSRRAESAERELRSLKVLLLLQDQLGETFDGVVTGVTGFGLFVQHPQYLVDGLLRMEDLGDDWWEADVKRGRIVGERSNQVFRLGNVVKVRIVDVDIPSRRLNLGLLDAESKGAGKGKSKSRQKPDRAKKGSQAKRTGKARTRSEGSSSRKPSRSSRRRKKK